MNLIEITIKNVFAHKDTTVEFKDGVNYIIGKNESGKSTILEMISFALFGSSALRTSIKDYNDAYVSLIFNISGTYYKVVRSSKDSLYKFTDWEKGIGEEIVTSKTAVNKHIIELLGYGLDVYNKMNFSKQLESNVHSTSTKNSRIDLINKVNGVEDANLFEQYLDLQRKSLASEIKGLSTSTNQVNIDFEYDEDFEQLIKTGNKFSLTIANLEAERQDLHVLLHDYDKLQTYVNSLGLLDDKELLDKYKDFRATVFDGSVVFSVKEYVSYLTLLIDKAKADASKASDLDAYVSRYKVISKTTNEYITLEEVQNIRSQLDNNKLYKQKEDLLSKGHITCPSCSTSFPLMCDSLKDLESIEYQECLYTESEYNKARDFVEQYKDNCITYSKQIIDLRESSSKVLTDTVKNDLAVHQALLEKITKAENNLAKYNSDLELFKTTYGEHVYNNIQIHKDKYQSLSKEIEQLTKLHVQFNEYCSNKKIYETLKASQEFIQEQVEAKQRYINDLETLIKKSKEFKLELQNMCIPLLNKKASYVINKMTGGEHYSLTISDTFELMMDDKPISSYSGSAQVTANVAFRIALIELFYKKKFPVFIGDEIDSFADEIRAQHIHNSLATLTDEGYQIILVSHHSLNFEGNVIDLNVIKGK